MEWIYDDGGRKAAGFKGLTGDCVTRAVAIAAQLPYKEVYSQLERLGRLEKPGKRHRPQQCHPRTGICKPLTRDYISNRLGWTWTPTMGIGTGCTVHMSADELPKGRLIVSVSRHLCAVIDGVLYDNQEASWSRWSGPDKRCVYGYWQETVPESGSCQPCKTGRGNHTCGLSGLQGMLRIGA